MGKCKNYNTCNLPVEIGNIKTEFYKQIDKLKDKLHKRNMQIKELKNKIQQDLRTDGEVE